MSSQLDQDALALLTEEERAAIADEDARSPEEIAALQRLAAGASDDDDDENDDDTNGNGAAPVEGKGAAPAPAPAAASPAPAAAPAADDGGAAAAAAAEAAAATPAPAPAPAAEVADDKPFRAEYVVELPADFDAKVTALTEREAEIWKKFDGGEIERADLQAQLRDLEKERGELNSLRVKAEISQEMRAQTAEQEWANTVNSFMASTAKAEGIDYRTDAARSADLDAFVKALASNQANAEKSMSWFLAEAHKRVKALHGDVAAAPAPAASAPAPAAAPAQTTAEALKAAAERRKPPVAAAPVTLAQIPGGDGPGDVGGSEFAHLDALEGDALEAAVAKMTPAQREQYSRGL